MRLPDLLQELQRRRVYRVSAAYAVAVFAVLQAADLVLPALPVPPWVYRALVIAGLAGFPLVVALAWVFDISPSGLRRTGPSPGSASEAVAGRPLLVGTVVVGLIGVGAWFAGRWSAPVPLIDHSATLAVLPFVPATEDPELIRIGRELVVTLSHSLSATAELDVAEPLAVLSTVDPGHGSLSRDRTREVAETLGAAHVVQGALLRGDDGLRLEMGLYETRTMQQVGADAVSGDRIDRVTNAATIAILRLIWSDSLFPVPNPGVMATGSTDALRAYLDGERAIAEGRWREAPEAFARAIAADSAFGPAYWRLQYALQYHGSPVDSVVRARAWELRHTLAERDRILLEARTAPTSRRLAILRDATTRFPTHWPAWWDLAEVLVHQGGYFGHTHEDSRAALERTLSLNPRFVSAWSHLFWMASRDRDVDAMSRILDELSSARFDQVSLAEAGINTLEYYRAQHAFVAAGDEIPDEPIQVGVGELTSYRGSARPEQMASSLLKDGFLHAQIRLARAVLGSGQASPSMARAQHFILAHALAGCEMWEDALGAADEFAASAEQVSELLVPYRLAVVGAWLGRLGPDAAAARRLRPASLVAADPDVLAEVLWLDGVLAFADGDGPALARAMERLAAGGGRWRDLLVGSLEAFQAGVEGDSATAGRRLHDLEHEWADQQLQFTFGQAHPFLNGVNRLVSARWLLAAGDTVAARRLLPWHEVVLASGVSSLGIANQVLATPALRLRADLAHAAGREREAGTFEGLLRERRPVAPGGPGG